MMTTQIQDYKTELYIKTFKINPVSNPFENVVCLDCASNEIIKTNAMAIGAVLEKPLKDKQFDLIASTFVQAGYLENLIHFSALLCEGCEISKDGNLLLSFDTFKENRVLAAGLYQMRKMLLHMRTLTESLLDFQDAKKRIGVILQMISANGVELLQTAFPMMQLFIAWVAHRGGDPETFRRYSNGGGFKLLEKARKKIKTEFDETMIVAGWNAASIFYSFSDELPKFVDVSRPLIIQNDVFSNNPFEVLRKGKVRSA